jgi:hypothetical protein
MMTKQTCENCAALEAKVEHLRSQLYQFDPTFSIKEALPTEEEAALLFARITKRFPQMRSPTDTLEDQSRGLRAAMGFVFTLARTEVPMVRYDGSWWTAEAMRWANSARMSCPRIRSVLIGVIASNDVPYCLDNSQLFLDPHGRGKAINPNAWRKLLAGAALREPVPRVKAVDDRSIGFVNEMARTW